MFMSNTGDEIHDFDVRYEEGMRGEAFLDEYFSRTYEIREATRDEQRRGIDRFFIRREAQDSKVLAIEYKTDKVASSTGNVFIEIVSVDRHGKSGWAYKSEADYLMYYLPEEDLIYMYEMETIRELLPKWQASYPIKPAKNRDYNTLGIVVEQAEFEDNAYWVFHC